MARAPYAGLQEHVLRTGVIRHGQRMLVGVSGGVDSMVLLHALQATQPQHGCALAVVHVHHGLRGKEADADAALVRDCCALWDIPFHLVRKNVRARMASKGLSLEMAAREARYEAFRLVARRVNAAALALAHTADDQAETLLLRLLRGSGPSGMAGMSPCSTVHGVTVVRPFLTIQKDIILAYANDSGISWREDRSNTDEAIKRNSLRKHVLPLLKQRFNPRVIEALCRHADMARDEEDLWTLRTDEARDACRSEVDDRALHVYALSGLAPALQRRVVHDWLLEQGIQPAFELVERVLQGVARKVKGSKCLWEGTSGTIWRQYDRLVVIPASKQQGESARQRVPVPGRLVWPAAGVEIVTCFGDDIQRPPRSRPGVWPARATLSRMAIGRAGLYVRGWRAADRMKPIGMQGHKRLQDIFTDAKVPRSERAHIPVIVCRNEIVWVPGFRIADSMQARAGEGPHVQILVRLTHA
jgi:tRNA(Ile)-lysidine synthase